MKIIVFGPFAPSKQNQQGWKIWGPELTRRGHQVIFFERKSECSHGMENFSGIIHPYDSWESALPSAEDELDDADVGIVSSTATDLLPATKLIVQSKARAQIFFDLDTSATLQRLKQSDVTDYVSPGGLVGFDLIFTFAEGLALGALKQAMGDQPVIVVDPKNVSESMEQALQKIFSTRDVSTSHDEGMPLPQLMTWEG